MHTFLLKIELNYYLFRYLTFRRITNLLLLALSYLRSHAGLQKLENCSPYFISIESSNFCNLHCPECPVGIRETPKSGRATFDFHMYQKIIDEMKPTLLHVILYFQGEPFLNKQLYSMIEYAKNAKIYTSTSTNGQFLSNNNAKKIVLSGLNKLIVSVDGTTQDVYETYRVGGNLEKTIDGIKKVIEWKKELKSITPLVEIQFIIFKTNEHQINKMKQLAKSLKVDKMTFKTAQLYDFEDGNELMPTNKRHSRYKQDKNGKYHIKSTLPNHCWRLWSGAVINTNGAVLPCCFDKNSDFSFGNIEENSFSTNWHSTKATDFRTGILLNRKQYEMCRNCTSK